MSQLFDQIAKETPQYVRQFVDISFDVSDRIQALLTAKGMQQRDLAKALGKQESEVSKWLSGTHNFTLKTLCKIASILESDIIQVSHGLTWHGQVQVKPQVAEELLTGITHETQYAYQAVAVELDELEQLPKAGERNYALAA